MFIITTGYILFESAHLLLKYLSIAVQKSEINRRLFARAYDLHHFRSLSVTQGMSSFSSKPIFIWRCLSFFLNKVISLFFCILCFNFLEMFFTISNSLNVFRLFETVKNSSDILRTVTSREAISVLWVQGLRIHCLRSPLKTHSAFWDACCIKTWMLFATTELQKVSDAAEIA